MVDARAIIAIGFMYLVIPTLTVYQSYEKVSTTVNITLMLLIGALRNGPYALISLVVPADLNSGQFKGRLVNYLL